MDSTDILIIALIIFLAIFVVFLLIREYINWYFKINKRIKLEQKISKNLEILIKGLAQSNIISAAVLQEMQSDDKDSVNERKKEITEVNEESAGQKWNTPREEQSVEKTERIPDDIPDL